MASISYFFFPVEFHADLLNWDKQLWVKTQATIEFYK